MAWQLKPENYDDVRGAIGAKINLGDVQDISECIRIAARNYADSRVSSYLASSQWSSDYKKSFAEIVNSESVRQVLSYCGFPTEDSDFDKFKNNEDIKQRIVSISTKMAETVLRSIEQNVALSDKKISLKAKQQETLEITSEDIEKLREDEIENRTSEFIRQHEENKQENPDSIIPYPVGDFFEAYGDDADLLAEILNFTIIKHDVGTGERINMVGFPIDKMSNFVTKIMTETSMSFTIKQRPEKDKQPPIEEKPEPKLPTLPEPELKAAPEAFLPNGIPYPDKELANIKFDNPFLLAVSTETALSLFGKNYTIYSATETAEDNPNEYISSDRLINSLDDSRDVLINHEGILAVHQRTWERDYIINCDAHKELVKAVSSDSEFNASYSGDYGDDMPIDKFQEKFLGVISRTNDKVYEDYVYNIKENDYATFADFSRNVYLTAGKEVEANRRSNHFPTESERESANSTSENPIEESTVNPKPESEEDFLVNAINLIYEQIKDDETILNELATANRRTALIQSITNATTTAIVGNSKKDETTIKLYESYVTKPAFRKNLINQLSHKIWRNRETAKDNINDLKVKFELETLENAVITADCYNFKNATYEIAPNKNCLVEVPLLLTEAVKERLRQHNITVENPDVMILTKDFVNNIDHVMVGGEPAYVSLSNHNWIDAIPAKKFFTESEYLTMCEVSKQAVIANTKGTDKGEQLNLFGVADEPIIESAKLETSETPPIEKSEIQTMEIIKSTNNNATTNYIVYSKEHGVDKRYGAIDFAGGRVGVGLMFATLFRDLGKAKQLVDEYGKEYPNFDYQIRKAGTSQVIYEIKSNQTAEISKNSDKEKQPIISEIVKETPSIIISRILPIEKSQEIGAEKDLISHVEYEEYTKSEIEHENESIVEKIHETETEPPESPPIKQELKAENFRITDDNFNIGGGDKTRFRQNIEAIKLLKQLEENDGQATLEEQEILSKYVGFGGLSQAFDRNNEKWANEYKELQEILTPSEYSSARASILSAYYTSPAVIDAMYNGLANLGFSSGRILEPSCGTGNFFGKILEEMQGSELHGVELDSISGRIAKQLYPQNDISVCGYEDKPLPENSFDVVLGNVPFGDIKINDKNYGKLAIHNYFIAKSLDVVKPGGIVAVVTSKGTLDSNQNTDFRKQIAEKAELLGAIRLPNNAFKGIAGTEVTSDILFLQKRTEPTEFITDSDYPDWVNIADFFWYDKETDSYEVFPMNGYFADNTDMILGNIVKGNKLYGKSNDTMCVPIEGAILKDQLAEAIKSIKGKISDIKPVDIKIDSDLVSADQSIPVGNYGIVDEKLYYRSNSHHMKLIETPKKTVTRAIGMIELRSIIHTLLKLQIENTNNCNEEKIANSRAELNEKYDLFIKNNGRVGESANMSAFKNDNTYHLIKGLEVYDSKRNFVRKADIFTTNTITPKALLENVDNASDALLLSIAEKARVDFEYMAI
ncbi:MAG: methyltransferase domain-containing protein [Oscillospiraceae bacterium]|nr:methyltransferase domain-containing protein [Oscillospiraceae bacterium]